MSERRIRRNKLRRARQLRMRICMVVMTFCMIIAASLLIGSLHLNAKADNDVPTYKYYKSILVNYGDTLWEIADDLDIPSYEKNDFVLEVMNINSIMNEEDIRAGEYLVVPYYSHEYLG